MYALLAHRFFGQGFVGLVGVNAGPKGGDLFLAFLVS